MEFVLWATKTGAPEWEEELITSTTNKARLEKAKEWAQANGFDRLRVSVIDGERPDFIGTINKGRRK